MTLSLELIAFWSCKFVVKGSTEVCDKRSDLGTDLVKENVCSRLHSHLSSDLSRQRYILQVLIVYMVYPNPYHWFFLPIFQSITTCRQCLSCLLLSRGKSLIRKAYEIFSEQKDSYGFLMDFSSKQKDFCQRCTRFFGVKCPSLLSRGKITDFFRTPPLKSQKNHIQKSQNHNKITQRKH